MGEVISRFFHLLPYRSKFLKVLEVRKKRNAIAKIIIPSTIYAIQPYQLSGKAKNVAAKRLFVISESVPIQLLPSFWIITLGLSFPPVLIASVRSMGRVLPPDGSVARFDLATEVLLRRRQ